MSLPKEGSREVQEGIIVAEAMDWCKSPTAIVPYKIWARQLQAADLADTVRQTDDRSHVKGSLVLTSHGDEPGVGGGVISGTRGAECTPKTWSATVRAEGRNMVRHDDEWWMNHKNTYGRLAYLKDPNTYDTPEVKTVEPRMQWAFYQAPDTATDAPSPGTTARAPAPETAPSPETPGWGDVATGIGKRVLTSPMGKFGPAVGAFLEVMTPTPLNKDEDVRISRRKCRPRQVFFKLGTYDRAEYQKQIDLQQAKLNAKGACKSRDDIDAFKGKTPSQKEQDRSDAEKAQKAFRQEWAGLHPGASMDNLAALHRLDMVAGGYKLDIADMGDRSVNSSIGSQWNTTEPGAETSRQQDVRDHADAMCREQCPLGIVLIVR